MNKNNMNWTKKKAKSIRLLNNAEVHCEHDEIFDDGSPKQVKLHYVQSDLIQSSKNQ